MTGLFCRLRSELRLYPRRALVAVIALEFVVVAAALLAGYDYAIEQTQTAYEAPINSCPELVSMEIPQAECEVVQASQAYSRSQLLELADRIGPPAGSSVTALGAISFSLGHLATLVGLVGLAVVVSVTLGEESRSSIAHFRDREALRGWAWPVRVGAIVLVWTAISVVVSAGTVVVGRFIESGEAEFGLDVRSTFAFLVARVVGGAFTVTVFAACVISVRRVLTNRARWLFASLFTIGLLMLAAITKQQLVPPTNLGYSAMHFEDDLMSYLDRFPLGLVVADGPISGLALAAVGIALAIGVCVAGVVRTRSWSSTR